MQKNILIISSDHTGHGHKSITESLCEGFIQYNDINIKVVDGFSLGGKILLKIGKSYGVITRNAKELWKALWKISLTKPHLINKTIGAIIETSFLDILEKVKPDLILSVHPNFNGSIMNIMDKHCIQIPFVTFIADLVSISPIWVDSRVNYIISPTVEAKNKCVQLNFPETKVKVLGFPVRSRFYKSYADLSNIDYNINMPLKCLIMSGGEGTENMSKIASTLLDNFNCKVKIITGRNITIQKKLENTLLKKYKSKIEVHGFVTNIQNLMTCSDIIFTRGSPNVMMEAVSCNVPLVITGTLPGQEEGNSEFALNHNLGVVCKELKHLQNTVSDLLSNDARKLNLIKKFQYQFANPNTAKNIVEFILKN
jgi:UDP-N-acetylglucosamine:LPS N-acetylglucosamine transferase